MVSPPHERWHGYEIYTVCGQTYDQFSKVQSGKMGQAPERFELSKGVSKGRAEGARRRAEEVTALELRAPGTVLRGSSESPPPVRPISLLRISPNLCTALEIQVLPKRHSLQANHTSLACRLSLSDEALRSGLGAELRDARLTPGRLAGSSHVSLGPPKRGVSKPTVYHSPRFALYKDVPSCSGQWSATVHEN